MKMRDAKARRDWWEYWVHFEFAIQLVLSYLEPKAAADVQIDFDKMDARIDAIQRSTDLAEQTKEMMINKMRAAFSDKHRYYVLKALNRIGIVKIAEEGIVDFDSTQITTLTKILRDSDDGSPTGKGMQILKDGALGKIVPDMTLVHTGMGAQGKILRMGTDDYKKHVNDLIDKKMAGELNEYATKVDVIDVTADDLKFAAEAEKTRMERTSAAAPDLPDAPDEMPPLPPSEFKLRIGHNRLDDENGENGESGAEAASEDESATENEVKE